MTTRYAILCIKAALALLWPSTLWAASITLSETVGQITPGVAAIVIALASLAGATALVLRIDRELRATPGQPLPRPWLFVSAHMLGSWLAGVLAFLICEAQGLGDWLELILIVLAGFAGSRFIEYALEHYLNKFLPRDAAPPKEPT